MHVVDFFRGIYQSIVDGVNWSLVSNLPDGTCPVQAIKVETDFFNDFEHTYISNITSVYEYKALTRDALHEAKC